MITRTKSLDIFTTGLNSVEIHTTLRRSYSLNSLFENTWDFGNHVSEITIAAKMKNVIHSHRKAIMLKQFSSEEIINFLNIASEESSSSLDHTPITSPRPEIRLSRHQLAKIAPLLVNNSRARDSLPNTDRSAVRLKSYSRSISGPSQSGERYNEIFTPRNQPEKPLKRHATKHTSTKSQTKAHFEGSIETSMELIIIKHNNNKENDMTKSTPANVAAKKLRKSVNRRRSQYTSRPLYEDTPRGKLVVAASTEQLVSLLYKRHNNDPDVEFSDIMLHVHSVFINPCQLFDILVSVYMGHVPTHFRPKSAQKIRMRIINFFKKWIWYFPFYPEVMNKFQDFLVKLEKEEFDESKRCAHFLRSAYQSIVKKEEACEMVAIANMVSVRKCRMQDISHLNIYTIDMLELARQLTVFDHNALCNISPIEFLSGNWIKGKGPNIEKFVSHTSTISSWIRYEVHSTVNFKQRVVVLSKCISLCKYLADLQNFNSGLAVYIGLELLNSYKEEWKAVSRTLRQQWKTLQSLLSMKGDFSALRKSFDSAENSLIVPLNILLHDLALIEEQTDRYKETELINFSKYRQVYGVYRHIERTKKSYFPFAPIDAYQNFLKNLKGIPDESHFKMEERQKKQNPKLKKGNSLLALLSAFSNQE